jgi:hypothetical protein
MSSRKFESAGNIVAGVVVHVAYNRGSRGGREAGDVGIHLL